MLRFLIQLFSVCSICGSPMAQDENGNWYCPNCDAEDIKGR